jgi:hypothetical protein
MYQSSRRAFSFTAKKMISLLDKSAKNLEHAPWLLVMGLER